MSEVDPTEVELLPEKLVPDELPLGDWHRAKGGRMVEFADYAMPIQYEGIMAEHAWVRENAGLFDVSHMGQIMLEGEGVAEALEKLCPGDISALGEGRMRLSVLLAEDGGILDDLMVTATPMGHYLVVNGAMKHEDLAFLRDKLPDSVIINYLDERALVTLQGPKAVDVLARIVPGVDQLFFMEAGSFFWNMEPLWISRSGYTGEDGFEISIPAEHVVAFADALCAQPEVKPIGLGARDSLRMEAGMSLYGHDLNPDIDPVQGNLSFIISKSRREQGGFHGATRILAALKGGPDKKRVGFAVEGKIPVREGAPIFFGDSEVGVITSGGFAPTVGAPIAMGYVQAGLAATGTALEAEVRGKRVPLTVAKMPFVPHQYVRRGATI